MSSHPDNTIAREANSMNGDPSPANGFLWMTSTASAGGMSWIATQLYQHGPGWPLVPPILFSAASVAGACVAALKARAEAEIRKAREDQEMRHREEKHALWIKSEQLRMDRGE
jgi:apolipoprotein N-acyltransferase